jgi:hypothetical protein
MAKNDNPFFKFLDWLAGIILFLVTLTVCVVIFKSIPKKKVSKIEFTFASPARFDTLKNQRAILFKNTDSLENLVNELKSDLQERETLKEEMLRIKNEDSDYQKIFAGLAALIFAIAAFFGFKSFAEIKKLSAEIALQTASETSKIIATEQANKVLNDDYITTKFNEAFETTKDLYEKDINDINDKIESIEALLRHYQNESNQDPTEGTKKQKDTDIGEEDDYLPESPENSENPDSDI